MSLVTMLHNLFGVRREGYKANKAVNDWLWNHSLHQDICWGKSILYKRVSERLRTQETNSNNTQWAIGNTVSMPFWKYNPYRRECGEGKFHACATPKESVSWGHGESDVYIAIEVKHSDMYAWYKGTPDYGDKIAFRKGKVLYTVPSPNMGAKKKKRK